MGKVKTNKFDYSQVDELTAKRLKRYEKEINEQFKKLGYAAYNLGVLKLGKETSFMDRVNMAADELEFDREVIIQSIAIYLDGEVKWMNCQQRLWQEKHMKKQ